MTPNPILKVLSTFQKYDVQALLIGGQACIIYGAVEFSRDSDFLILVSSENLVRLRRTLSKLQAENVYFPPLKAGYLRRGHACHFRCQAEDVRGLRVDLLARLRGCDDFDALWRRRMRVELPDGQIIPIIGLRDLVQSKKTQRDKDWFMLRRLVENDIRLNREGPRRGQASWWLMECRNPETLTDLANVFTQEAKRLVKKRPLIQFAIRGEEPELTTALLDEEGLERERDRKYWKPLREELEKMRRERSRSTRRGQ